MSLFVEVKNPLELKSDLIAKRLVTENLDLALIKAKLVLDWRHLACSASKAALNWSRKKAQANSLGAEIVYNLSNSKNVGEGLRLFGIGEGDDSVVAVMTGKNLDEITR